MNRNEIVALIFGSILIGFGLGYEVSLFLVPTPEPEVIEKIIYEPQSNLLRDLYLTGERGVITLTNQHYSVVSGPLLRGVSLELINCSNIFIMAPFIWTNYSYGIRVVGCVNITVSDFYIRDADIGIIVINSTDSFFGSPDYDYEEMIFPSIIENWKTHPVKVLDSERITISGVNATIGGS